MAKNYITHIGHKNLQEELRRLKMEERPKVVEVVSWAAGNGDRSENGDYIYGKKRLREIDSRIRHIVKRLEKAEVVNPSETKSDKVLFGAKVKVLHEDDSESTYQIVGEDEAVAEEKKISWKSPLARCLLGKTVGDEVLLKKPKSEEYLEILEIEYS
jgi:transcription elongation factor GreB